MNRNQSLPSEGLVAKGKGEATQRTWPLLASLSQRIANAARTQWGKTALVMSGLISLSLIGRCSAATPPPRPHAAIDVAPLAVAALPAASQQDAAAPAVTGIGVTGPSDPPHVLTASSKATPEDPVVLNQATIEDLRRLPRVGPKKAEAILQLRQKMGRFRQVEDLLRVKGIGRATLKKLRPLLRVDPPAVQPSAPLTRRMFAPSPPSFSSIFS